MKIVTKQEGTVWYCDFCGKHQDFVDTIVTRKESGDAAICDECVAECVELFKHLDSVKAPT